DLEATLLERSHLARLVEVDQLEIHGRDYAAGGASSRRAVYISPPWCEHAPDSPPEWLHSPSAHWTTVPLPFGKFGMQVCVVQNSASPAWVLDPGPSRGAL